jgi:hypothetical protein
MPALELEGMPSAISNALSSSRRMSADCRNLARVSLCLGATLEEFPENLLDISGSRDLWSSQFIDAGDQSLRQRQ